MDALGVKLRLIGQLYPQFVDGFLVTIGVAATALPLAVGLALVIAALRWLGPRWLAAILAGYVEFMRNTPLLLQLFVLYFGMPLLGWRLDGFYCGAIAIGLQHAAFLAETFRGAMESISRRQWEAGRALGMRERTALIDVIIPQAVIRVAAPIGNQLVILVKDTSAVSGIGVLDLTLTGKLIMERTAASFEVFVVIATFYLVLTTLLGLAVRAVEARTRLLIG